MLGVQVVIEDYVHVPWQQIVAQVLLRAGVGLGGLLLLAALADLPQATFASKVEVADGKASVTREVDGGLEVLSLSLPAIITTDLRLNEPRYVTLPNIMKAKKKQMDIFKPEDLGVDVSPHIKTLKVVEPPKRSAGIKVADVAALVDKLKNEAKVI